MDGPTFGSYTDPDGDIVIRRLPISFVDALPGAGAFPGHIFFLRTGAIGLYVWDGSSFVGPLGTGGGGGGAPTTAQYVVMTLDGTLSNERRLQAGAGLQLTDGGANGDASLLVPAQGITRAMLLNAAGLSVIGRSLNSAGPVGDIPVTAASGLVLREAAGLLGFGQVATLGIQDAAVTLAKLANIASDRLIGRDTAGNGVPEELSVGVGLEFFGPGSVRRAAIVGDVSVPAGSNTAVLRDAVGFTVLGRAITGVGPLNDIGPAADGEVLFRSGPSIIFGRIPLGSIGNVSADKLLGRGNGGGAGPPQEITLGTNLSMSGTTLNAAGGGGSVPTGTGFRHVTSGVEDAAAKLVDTADINDDQVTFAKMQNVTTDRLLGRNTAGTGNVEELELGTGLEWGAAGPRLLAASGSEPAMLCVDETGAIPSWRRPATYPAYPLLKSAGGPVSFPKISDSGSVTMPTNPVTGQFYYHKDHKCLYVFDSVANVWLSSHTYEIWFGCGNADIAATNYCKFHEVNTFATFTDTVGHIIGGDVKVVGMGVSMANSHGATVTFQVFDDGSGVTGATLSLGSSDTRGADETLMSNTIAANSVIGVKVTAGSFEQPGRGVVRLRRVVAP